MLIYKLVSNRKYNGYNIFFEENFPSLLPCRTTKCKKNVKKNHILTTSCDERKLREFKQNMFKISICKSKSSYKACLLNSLPFFLRCRREKVYFLGTGNGRTESLNENKS